MGYRTLRECVEDLRATARLVCLEDAVDARLEAAEIHRRVVRSGGPAVLFANVAGCRFPMVSNLFGSLERAHFIFRDTLDAVRRLIEWRLEPEALWRRPGRYWKAARAAWNTRPRRRRMGPVLAHEITVDQLPQLQSWPDDGGAFITLPMVYSEDPEQPGMGRSNLGMYRVQISGGEYAPNGEVGLHYQIHRGIGVHHAAAIRLGRPFPVNVFVGGSPAMMLAAVMPLPEGLSELALAGSLAGYRIPMVCRPDRLPVYAEADFCIRGLVDPHKRLPEGPFGDHLGYYSLRHDFPVLRVEEVCCRKGAIWPFTVVGRPPQEDTIFGQLVQELSGPVTPAVLPGVHAVHAVDAAGVHPLMLAIGSERYCPMEQLGQPRELLTQANAILGYGQMSLTKYLMIVERHDDPELEIRDVAAFFRHVLVRVDWRRDLHFQTRTTIDTLDYSGPHLHEGSKLVIAAAGEPRRELPSALPASLRLPPGFRAPRICLPGVLAVEGPVVSALHGGDSAAADFCDSYDSRDEINCFPWIVIVDDSDFAARTLDNFLWVVFTRSNPAADVYGVAAFTEQKHWGCRGAFVIDARVKPHHARQLTQDAQVARKVDALAARGGPLAKYL